MTRTKTLDLLSSLRKALVREVVDNDSPAGDREAQVYQLAECRERRKRRR